MNAAGPSRQPDAPPPGEEAMPQARQAVTALYQEHALGLIRLAVVMLGDRAAAEDVVQEAFCGLYRRWHGLSDPGKALSYVRSSVINGCRTVLRRRRRQVGQALKHSHGRTDLEVVTLSTGSTRVWAAASGFFRSGAGDSRGLSWTADGRELAFEWQPNNVGQWPGVEARLLNLTSPGGDLMAASRRIIATTRQFTPSGSTFQVADAENEPVVTPDGSAIVTNMVYFQVKTKESGQATNGRYGFAEYSTRTGKLVRILGYWKIKPAGYFFTQVLWSSPSGRVLIGVIPDGRIGVINGNEFTPLNVPPVPSVVMDIGLGAGAGAW